TDGLGRWLHHREVRARHRACHVDAIYEATLSAEDSKMASRLSGEIPGPRSATLKCAFGPSRHTRTRISPPGAYAMALPNRFAKIWGERPSLHGRGSERMRYSGGSTVSPSQVTRPCLPRAQ